MSDKTFLGLSKTLQILIHGGDINALNTLIILILIIIVLAEVW